MRYRLTRAADEDITRVYLTGAETFGTDQADRYHGELAAVFELLALHPEMARERNEINPPVRIHPHGSHVIVYRLDGGRILILRVRHARENWDTDAL